MTVQLRVFRNCLIKGVHHDEGTVIDVSDSEAEELVGLAHCARPTDMRAWGRAHTGKKSEGLREQFFQEIVADHYYQTHGRGYARRY